MYTRSSFILTLIAMLSIPFTSGCSSMSTLPKTENLTVSRKPADKKCSPLGKLEGRSLSKTAKPEDALEDLKKEAANKGANYLVVKEYSGTGGAVTGLAYICP